jgi:predicted ArsR family transcriptional regulator
MNEARQLRRRVLAHVRSYRHGTTAYEVAVALGVATDQAAIVLGLLHARGLVARSGFRRRDPDGRYRALWIPGRVAR